VGEVTNGAISRIAVGIKNLVHPRSSVSGVLRTEFKDGEAYLDFFAIHYGIS